MRNYTKLIKAIRNPKKIIPGLKWESINWLIKVYNYFIDLINLKSKNSYNMSNHNELNEIKKRSLIRNDISDHLVTLFIEALSIKPKLMVELGVRGGESTFVLERVAKLCNSNLVSVDIEDCSHISSLSNWLFFQGDDIEFANNFEKWCDNHDIKPIIDVIFIDTNHLYEHTIKEIHQWFPFLSNNSKVFFHDTNCNGIYFRKDGSMGIGWNNKRGVTRALETYFNKKYNEKKDFIDFRKGWIINHHAFCNGFTILTKIDKTP